MFRYSVDKMTFVSVMIIIWIYGNTIYLYLSTHIYEMQIKWLKVEIIRGLHAQNDLLDIYS